METILVPTDFSRNAENALKYAVDLAKKEGAKIILMHACHNNYINSDVPYFEIGDVLVKTRKDSKKMLKAMVQQFIEPENIPYDTMIVEEFPVEAITLVLAETEVDLIVMGTKGASGIMGTVFGSNTATVIERVKVPVMAIPESAPFHPIKKITYATSYFKSDFEALARVVEIAEPYGAQLNLLHISDGKNSTENERILMETFIAEAKVKAPYENMNFELLTDQNTEHALQKYIDDESADMLVMSTHHRDFFDKIFGKSYTQQMAYHTKIPLLAFHHG